MRRLVRFALPASAFALLVAAAGCSSSAGSTASSASASTSAGGASASASASASPDGSAEASSPQAQAALAAYHAMIADWVAAGLTANYQDPALAHHMSGSALSQVTRHLYVEKTEGVVVRGTPQLLDVSFGQMVPASNPTEIVINSCFSDASWLEYTTDGHLYNNIPGGRRKTQVLVVAQNGTWKVDQLAMNAVGTC
jgi:hypothetical protein